MKNLYNKYRPKCLGNMIAKNAPITYLQHAIVDHNILNAYIVSGPFGNGKTTLARIMAKAFNCVNFKDKNDICNNCDGCKYALLEGTEVDTSSRRGINEIKELVERFMPVPMFCKFRTIILDEAHMLSNDAFGFLLKLLEEPPLHMVFILVTTEYDKLPDTIKSRGVSIFLPSYSEHDMKQVLNNICSQENITLRDDILTFICRKSSRSMRSALNLLEQMQYVHDNVEIIVNFETDNIFVQLHTLLQGEWDDLYNFVDKLSNQGMQSTSFFRSFLNFAVSQKMLYYNYILEIYFEVLPYEESCSGERFYWALLLRKLWKMFHK